MASIRIFQSPIAAERIQQALDFAEAFPPATEMLFLGATREASDDFARELAVRRGATFGIHRFSLTQLAARLALNALAERDVAPATPLAAEALAARITFEALERDGLQYFGPVGRLPGFARALAATIQDLRKGAVAADRLGELPRTGRDLQKLLELFKTQLEEGRLADRTALFEAGAERISEKPGPFFAGWPVLLLDVHVDSKVERRFVEMVMAAAQEVLATVPAGDEKTMAALLSLRGSHQAKRKPAKPARSLERLQEFLFSLADSAAPGGRPGSENSVSFFSAPGEGRECIEIARRTLEEARGGVRFDRIAVLLRAPDTYASLLESALRRAGIPSYFAPGTKLPDVSGRAFLALLACAAERLSARRFAEYLSLGQVPGLDPSGAPPLDRDVWIAAEDEALAPPAAAQEPKDADASDARDDGQSGVETPVLAGTLRAPWNWERLLVEAAVIGGKERWQRRLNGLAAELEVKLAELHAEEPDSARTQGVARDLENLAHLRAFVLPVVQELASLPQNAAWGEWLASLERLAPMVLRHPARVLTVLAELRPMAEIGPVAIEEVREVLADRLTTLEQPPAQRRFGRVFVSTPAQIRGRSFEVVFVPGLAERIFPQKLREDPLLLDDLRERLKADLDTRETRAEEERLRLRLGIGAASERVYLSYPRLELGESRPRVPSFYALDIQRAMTGRIPDHRELEREAFRAAGARLAWPAPSEPARAIDEMEHDLAVLGLLLHNPERTEVQGRARYLFELNPDLARSLRTRHMRWKKGWSGFDGPYQLSPAALAALAPHRLRARPFSVSALQKYAVCPYQFLLSAIYRLEPREESVPLERMDPLTRGHLFHRVQAELQRELARRGSLPVVAESVGPASKLLDEVLDSVAADYYEKLAPAIDRVWKDEIEALRVELRGWINRVAEAGGGWEPFRFEFGFGLPSRSDMDPESRADPVTLEGGWQLHGVVDMIERRRDSSDLRVTDHKTGKNWTRDAMIVGGGEVLQPVLYGLAVEIALGARVAESRLFYCTSTGNFSERPVKMNPLERNCGLQVLEVVDQALERGILLPAPRTKACTWCDFREVCGPLEELRTTRKGSYPFAGLAELRGLP